MLVAASALALSLHAVLLSGDDASPAPAAGAPPVVTVRTLAAPELEMAAVAPPALRPDRTVRRAPPPPARPTRVAAPLPQGAAPRADAETAVEVAPEAVKTVAGPASAASPESPESVPVYRTVLPPGATLHYEMKRGMFSVSGELYWRPAGDRYEARLEGRVAGLLVLTETSTGLIDAHGLAPLRYTDQRVRRGINAANFQRDKGKITYSGPQIEVPLPPGAQDRVSWMVQIGGVLNAEPQLAAPGGRIVFFVSGARGDADVWAFRYAGADTLPTPMGSIRAVKFTREPRKSYDRQVEIWLAPAQRHLPVRARFTATADGEVFELLLRDMQTP